MFNIFQNKKKLNSENPFAIQTGMNKYGRIEGGYHHDWAEEVYLSGNAGKETIAKSFDFSKLQVFGAILLFLLLSLIAKTAWLQIVKRDYYYSMAEGNRIRIERIEPKRGIIYDRDYHTLVRNNANFLLYFIPADLPDDKQELNDLVDEISEVLEGQSEKEITLIVDKIDRHSPGIYKPLFIADNIPYEKAMKLYMESANLPGVVLSSRTRREYEFTGNFIKKDGQKDFIVSYYALSHIMGYTGKINPDELARFGQEYLPIDYIGKMGIEYFWENELKGKSGEKQIEVDALGKEKKIISSQPAEDGHNLVLSIDINQQLKLEEILANQLSKMKLSRASAVVLDPKNGEILAMVSLPAYNNNQFARGITEAEYDALVSQPDKPLFNRAISGEFPSGSTIKPVMSAAALEEGVITEKTKIISTGGIRIGQWFFPDYLAGGHGGADVKRALAESINTFYYYIGGGYENFKGLGVDRIVNYFQMFGLGSQTGIDLAGEASGLVPTPSWKDETKKEKWYIGDTYHLSIGQGDLLVTPLQVAVFTGFFANGGKLYQPHFIRQVLGSDDRLIKEAQVEPIKKDFIDQYNIEIVREGMRQGVTAGSSRSLQTLPVSVAGKTGTAQWSTKLPPHAWFTGFAPYDDPELVITVLVEEGGEGHLAAVPVAKEFLDWYFGEYKETTSNK